MSSPSINGRPKTAINFEEWELQVPIDDMQARSVNSLKDLCQERKLPLKFSSISEYASRPSSPARVLSLRSPIGPSRPQTPLKPNGDSKPSLLHPKQPIETPEQFHDWFAAIDRSFVHSQDAHFHAHLEDVSQYREMCETLLQTINDLESELDSIFMEWRRVEESGHSLKESSEQLLRERDNLLEITEAISLRLEYFQELDHVTRMLNSPGESLVLQADFLLMVERVDVCLEYLNSHQDFQEARVYILRFHQCLMRAMTLVRMFFVASLRALTADVQRRTSDKDMSDTAHIHLLYSKFTMASIQVAPLLAELEKKANKYPNEVGSLLTECHSAYFNSRKSLLFSRVTSDIRGLDLRNSDLVELTRNGCTYMRQLCIDETALYSRFFHTGEDQLSHYLETLGDFLFDDLRPRILHESRLTTLCEVCTVLQALIDLDVEPMDLTTLDTAHDSDNASEGDGSINSQEVVQPRIRPLLQLILQDAQTRLVFKAQTLMESDIRFYKPNTEDVAYPSKLQLQTKQLITPRDPMGKEMESFMKLLPANAYPKSTTWYPTIRKTLWILSQLHEFINPVVFNDIAQEAIEFCRQSLKVAADQIIANSSPDSITHGQLFLIQQLLVLKEIVGLLNLTYRNSQTRPELDTFGTVLRNTSALLQSTRILSLVGSSDDQSIDVPDRIDNDLGSLCNDLVSRYAENATVPLRSFLERWNTLRSSKDHELARPSEAINIYENFRHNCENSIRTLGGWLHAYLEDDKTIGFLMNPIKTKIAESYNSFRDLVEKEYPGEIERELLSSHAFSNFLDGLDTHVNTTRNNEYQ